MDVGVIREILLVLGTGGATWVLQAYRLRNDHAAKVEQHRDDLTLQLLGGARAEMTAAKAEVEGLRNEVRALRSLELHFFHFQQALDHLESILTAATEAERLVAHKNAQAFLNRMRKNEQKEQLNAGAAGAA